MIKLQNIIENLVSLYDDPSRWEYKNKNWGSKALKAKTTKKYKEYTLAYLHHTYEDFSKIYALDANGVIVGELFFGKVRPEDNRMEGAIEIHPQHRRQGLASEMYAWAEEIYNLPMVPSYPHSKDAAKFWANPNRKFGIKEEEKPEKEAFRLEREGKISFDIKRFGDREFEIHIYANEEYVGYIDLTLDVPMEMVGAKTWIHGYILVDHIAVNRKHEGYGFLLYKEALKLAQSKKLKGLASYHKGRSMDADYMWNKLKTFSDSHYDYVDIEDLATRIKENSKRF